jgi:hypothetical protein
VRPEECTGEGAYPEHPVSLAGFGLSVIIFLKNMRSVKDLLFFTSLSLSLFFPSFKLKSEVQSCLVVKQKGWGSLLCNFL